MAFKIFLIYHSHIDIGYTERQEKIAVYQADFVRQGVEYALSDAQTQRGEKSKFRFTAEGFWAVEQYLRRYGEEGRARLVAAAKSGNFELTGGYFHMAELLDYDNLAHTLDYAQEFAADNGLPAIKTVMAADINGFSAGFADAMCERGFENLITCINTHHGGAPFDKPLVPFWWRAQHGGRVLVWNGLTYHKANLLGLIPGSTPVGDPGVPGMKVDETGFVDVEHPDDYAKKRIFAMVEALKNSQDYPYEFMPLMGSGLYTDNSPNEDLHCALIEEWNALYGDEIEICTATLDEFFDYLRAHTDNLPEYAGDWTDWWTDGAASTPAELGLHRNAQRLLKQIKRLDPDCRIVSETEREAIANKLMLFAEHTWGHSQSFYQPCHLIVNQLDVRKANHAVQADILANIAFDKLGRALGEGEFAARRPFEYVVVNPYDRAVTTAVYLPTDFWEEGSFVEAGYKVRVRDGRKALAAQRAFTLRGSFVVAVVTLAPKERKVLTLEFGRAAKGARCLDKKNKTFANGRYTLTYDKQGVASLVETATGKELLFGEERLGQPVYQVFPKAERWRAAGFGYSSRETMRDEIDRGRATKVAITETGPVFTRLAVDYRVKGAYRYRVVFTLYNELSKIEIGAECVKTLELDPEGMYIALPFGFGDAEWYLDKPGAILQPGDQLPKTCCDYYAVDRGLIAFDGVTAVTVNTQDAPLVMIGGLKLWQYTKTAQKRGTAYTWLTNNKWETNFRAQCAGCLESRYIVDFAPAERAKDAGKLLEVNECEVAVLRR